MSSAIWSAAADDAHRLPLRFPADLFREPRPAASARQPAWRTVVGGSRRYVEALVRPFRERLRLRAPVGRIRRHAGGVDVHTREMGWEPYDVVVVAAHADQALALVEQPAAEERSALGAIPYRRNVAVLHTDARVLPRARARLGRLEHAGRRLPRPPRHATDDLPHEPPAAPAEEPDLVRHPQRRSADRPVEDRRPARLRASGLHGGGSMRAGGRSAQ